MTLINNYIKSMASTLLAVEKLTPGRAKGMTNHMIYQKSNFASILPLKTKGPITCAIPKTMCETW